MQWIFNLTLSDVFNSKQFGYYISTDSFNQDMSRRRETRYLRFSVTYLFGKFDTSLFKKMGRSKGGGTNMGTEGAEY
jgi:hypothetical protein